MNSRDLLEPPSSLPRFPQEYDNRGDRVGLLSFSVFHHRHHYPPVVSPSTPPIVHPPLTCTTQASLLPSSAPGAFPCSPSCSSSSSQNSDIKDTQREISSESEENRKKDVSKCTVSQPLQQQHSQSDTIAAAPSVIMSTPTCTADSSLLETAPDKSVRGVLLSSSFSTSPPSGEGSSLRGSAIINVSSSGANAPAPSSPPHGSSSDTSSAVVLPSPSRSLRTKKGCLEYCPRAVERKASFERGMSAATVRSSSTQNDKSSVHTEVGSSNNRFSGDTDVVPRCTIFSSRTVSPSLTGSSSTYGSGLEEKAVNAVSRKEGERVSSPQDEEKEDEQLRTPAARQMPSPISCGSSPTSSVEHSHIPSLEDTSRNSKTSSDQNTSGYETTISKRQVLLPSPSNSGMTPSLRFFASSHTSTSSPTLMATCTRSNSKASSSNKSSRHDSDSRPHDGDEESGIPVYVKRCQEKKKSTTVVETRERERESAAGDDGSASLSSFPLGPVRKNGMTTLEQLLKASGDAPLFLPPPAYSIDSCEFTEKHLHHPLSADDADEEEESIQSSPNYFSHSSASPLPPFSPTPSSSASGFPTHPSVSSSFPHSLLAPSALLTKMPRRATNEGCIDLHQLRDSQKVGSRYYQKEKKIGSGAVHSTTEDNDCPASAAAIPTSTTAITRHYDVGAALHPTQVALDSSCHPSTISSSLSFSSYAPIPSSRPDHTTPVTTATVSNGCSSCQAYPTGVVEDRLGEGRGSVLTPSFPSRILDFLYLGGVEDATDIDTLRKYHITTILNISEEEYWCPDRNVVVHPFVIADHAATDIASLFTPTRRLLDKARAHYFKAQERNRRLVAEQEKEDGRPPRVCKSPAKSDGSSSVPQEHSKEAEKEDCPSAWSSSTPCREWKRRKSAREKEKEIQKGIMAHAPPCILVHCKKGQSRSATIVCAYLIYRNGWSVDHALRYMRMIRPCVAPNIGFLHSLRVFQEQMLTTERRQCRAQELSVMIKNIPLYYLDEPQEKREKEDRSGCSENVAEEKGVLSQSKREGMQNDSEKVYEKKYRHIEESVYAFFGQHVGVVREVAIHRRRPRASPSLGFSDLSSLASPVECLDEVEDQHKKKEVRSEEKMQTCHSNYSLSGNNTKAGEDAWRLISQGVATSAIPSSSSSTTSSTNTNITPSSNFTSSTTLCVVHFVCRENVAIAEEFAQSHPLLLQDVLGNNHAFQALGDNTKNIRVKATVKMHRAQQQNLTKKALKES